MTGQPNFIRMGIFASGGGSNARELIHFFKDNPKVKIGLLLTNNPNSGVISMGKKHDIPVSILSKKEFNDENILMPLLKQQNINFISLAGFLLLLPSFLVKKFPNAIVNIHPSILPKYGGKGMYGMFVHEAVKNAGEKVTGCTIHLVNEKYDEGEILFQKSILIKEGMSAEDIAAKVLHEEHTHYGKTILTYLHERFFLNTE